MKKPVVIGIIIAVVLIIAIGGTVAISHKSTKDTGDMGNMDTHSSSSDNSTTDTSTTPTATNTVTIQNFAFSPADITVKKDTTVTWTNKDGATHDVTETDGKSGPDSGNLANGKSYSFTYDTVGTFAYHCSIHPDMVGKVTVTE